MRLFSKRSSKKNSRSSSSPKPNKNIDGLPIRSATTSADSAQSHFTHEQPPEQGPVADVLKTVNGPGDASRRKKCWNQSLEKLKHNAPEKYVLLELPGDATIDELISGFESRLDALEKKAKGDSQWFARLKRSLPAMASIKGVTMAVARADPHQLAPYICAGVFCAVELLLNTVSADDQLLILEITSEISIVFQKWSLRENHLSSLFAGRSTEALTETLFSELSVLYDRCLDLHCSIRSYLKNKRLNKALSKVDQVDVEWKALFEGVKRSNKECDAIWSRAEFLAKARKDDEAILDWISQKPFSVSHNQIMERTGVLDRYQHRAMWFFESQSFQEWRSGSKQVLWLFGPVGFGKTTTICRIIESLMLDESLGAGNRRCYFYCQATAEEVPTCEVIIRSLLRQLTLCKDFRICTAAESAYYRHEQDRSHKSSLSLGQWQDIFHSVLSSSDGNEGCLLIIDALDECTQDVNDLLRFLKDLVVEHPKVYLILSSQLHINVGSFFNSDTLVTTRIGTIHTAGDIQHFVTTEIKARADLPENRTASIFSSDQTLCNKFKANIVSKSNGMFQWAKVWLALMVPPEPITLRSEVDQLLKTLLFDKTDGLDSLNKAYLTLYLRVRHGEHDRRMKVRIYRIILGARTLMTAATLATAAAVEDDGTMTTVTESYIREVCHNFFIEMNGRMMRTHESAETFLQGMLNSRTTNKAALDDFSATASNAELARICSQLLMRRDHPVWKTSGQDAAKWTAQVFSAGWYEKFRHKYSEAHELQEIDPTDVQSLNLNHFIDFITNLNAFAAYTLVSGLVHMEIAISTIENKSWHLVEISFSNLLTSITNLQDSALPYHASLDLIMPNLMYICTRPEESDPVVRRFVNDIGIAVAHLGTLALMDYKTMGNFSSCVLKMADGTLDIGVFFLISSLRLVPLRLLHQPEDDALAGAKVMPSLLKQARDLLRTYKPMFSLRNIDNDTPLMLAVDTGQCELVRAILLLEKEENLRQIAGSKVWTSDLMLMENSERKIPLHIAVSCSHPMEMITLLLEFEADQKGCVFSAEMDQGQLRWVSRHACLSDDFGNTPLHLAIVHGKPDVLSLLMRAGAAQGRFDNGESNDIAINTGNYMGYTLLMIAIDLVPRTHFNDTVSQLLLEKNLDINHADCDRNTALHHMMFVDLHEIEDIHACMKTFLARPGIEIDLRNLGGETALFLAAKLGQVIFTQMLCERPDANPDAANSEGNTPLWIAQYQLQRCRIEERESDRWRKVIEVLLAMPEVDKAPMNQLGQTPQEAANVATECLKYRVTNGVDPYRKHREAFWIREDVPRIRD